MVICLSHFARAFSRLISGEDLQFFKKGMNTNTGLITDLLEVLMFDCNRITHHIPVTLTVWRPKRSAF